VREDDAALDVEGALVPLHPQVKAMLDALAAAGGAPLEDMDPVDARAMYRQLDYLASAEDIARVEDRAVPGPDGDVPVRVYWPAGAEDTTPGALLWLHGGGWVIGDLESADATARALANRSGAIVVSVDYRLSPEHVAPAALDDCAAALAWTVANADDLGIDATRIAVGGDSAGGNLAALLCQRSRAEDGPAIAFQLLVYPVTDLTQSHPSYEENATGYFLTKAGMTWFIGHHVGTVDPKDPLVSPLHVDSCEGLPPALVITAEFDPLRDEGEAYAARLREAGVPAELVRYDGQIHGFFSMTAVLEDAPVAIDRAGAALRAALA
jgi:acetyl esterase